VIVRLFYVKAERHMVLWDIRDSPSVIGPGWREDTLSRLPTTGVGIPANGKPTYEPAWTWDDGIT